MKTKNMKKQIFKKEIKDLLRDKKTLIYMILIPLLLYPILMGGMLIIENSAMDVEGKEYTFGLTFEVDETLKDLGEQLNIKFVKGTQKEFKEEINNKERKIDLYIGLEENTFKIYYSSASLDDQPSYMAAYQLLETYIEAEKSKLLVSEGLIPDEILKLYTIEEESVSDLDYSTNIFVGMIPSMIMMTTALTATISVIDMTAGEKERGTLETLLTFPLKVKDIILGKLYAASFSTFISSILGFTSMYTTFYILSKNLEIMSEMKMLSLGNALLILIALGLFSILMCAVSMIIAIQAKSFKEAQNSTQPISFVCMIPMFLPMMGIKSSVLTSFIPVINVGLLINDVMNNTVVTGYFVIAILSTILLIGIAMGTVSKLFKSDKILFS